MPLPFTGDVRSIRRPDYLPRSKRPFYEIHRIDRMEPTAFLILSEHPETVLVHAVQMGPYNAWRTQPCTGEGERCHLSHAEYAIRWQAWLWVVKANTRKVGLVTLTEGAVGMCPRLLDPAEDLRGRVLKLWRKRNEANSLMLASLDERTRLNDQVVAVPSLIAQLGSLWSAPPRTDKGKDCPQIIRDIRSGFGSERGTP
jgi:hypothetical protein